MTRIRDLPARPAQPGWLCWVETAQDRWRICWIVSVDAAGEVSTVYDGGNMFAATGLRCRWIATDRLITTAQSVFTTVHTPEDRKATEADIYDLCKYYHIHYKPGL